MARRDTIFGLTREERRALADNPAFQVAALGLSAVVLGAAWASQNATPERRAETRKRRKARDVRQREGLERREADSMRRKALNAFFASGLGKEQYEARCITSYRAVHPFPDATFANQPAGFRQTAFVITSASAGLTLRADFDVADQTGGVRLSRADETLWSMTAVFHDGVISPYYGSRDYDPEGASLAANLLGVPGCPFDTITLVHPNASDIKGEIWSDHMLANPELAERLRWDPERPLY